MQDRYVGDIGDYIKLALLRAVASDQRLGVIWYRVADETHNGDGGHVAYLRDARWRALDPMLFDRLGALVTGGMRSIEHLERVLVDLNPRFVADHIPLPGAPANRVEGRQSWLRAATAIVSNCNVVFLDPDNGLEPEGFRPASRASIKCATFADLQGLSAPDRTLIVYHHHTRRPGGHLAELAFLAGRLRTAGFRKVHAIRARAYSPRAFFILNGSSLLLERAQAFAATWSAQGVTWHGNLADGPYGEASE